METPTVKRKFDPQAMKRLRKKHKISQPIFAAVSGIPLDTIRMYEQGRTLPSVERLFIIADTFGCALDELCATNQED